MRWRQNQRKGNYPSEWANSKFDFVLQVAKNGIFPSNEPNKSLLAEAIESDTNC